MSEDAAEKEASEVLHSLLSVERIEKQEIIVTGVEQSPPSFHTSHNDGGGDNEATIQYTPISISHSLFSAIDGTSHFANNMDDSQVVIWEGHAIVDPLDSNNMTTIYTGHQIDDTTTDVESVEVKPLEQKLKIIKPEINNAHQVSASATNHNNKKTRSSPPKKKRKLSSLPNIEINNDITKLEDNPSQVKDKFKRGCECQDESCFRGLNPETVFKHRNNIAELTKGEHDMYLMGVTMASLSNPDTTVRQRERRRLRAQYIYQGRRVCLDAFLYLENCTHYQLKRIRKHVMTHGVAPRVHGNHGKKPHNTFSLDIYCHAREFLKQYLEQHTGESDILNMKQSIQLPWDVTRKNLHDAYKEYGQILEPGVKLMGCSTFRHFLKDQFPHVKFCKLEPKSNNQSQQNQQQQQQITVQAQINSSEKTRNQQPTGQQSSVQKCIINNEVQQVIPLVVSSNENQGNQHQQSQTFLVTTPVPQLISNANIVTSQNAPNNNSTTYSYQITNGYLINDQGNIVSTTLTNNGQNQASYFKDLLATCEEIEMQNQINNLEPLGVNDVVDLLQHNYAIISGGKSNDGCPIITFPDNNNFQMISDTEYQRLMLYLTSVPTLQEADMGFHLIIDRRKDRWNSVKTVLLKISVFFPGLIHVVYVLRPASFLQKALSEVSNKLSKDEFKFRMIVLSTAEELHEYINSHQLTVDLKGTLNYNHQEWINQRIELENFSSLTQQVSNALDEFTKLVDETELPNNVESTQDLLIKQNETYSELKKDILSAAKLGESLLYSIKEKNHPNKDNNSIPDMIDNVFAVERLLVQLEETEKTFDEFWQHHSMKLRHCLELRRFEQDFKELQVNFDLALKRVDDMTELGETVSRADALIKDTNLFEKICQTDIQRAEESVSSGQMLMKMKNSYPIECVEPKCNELLRMKEMLLRKLSKRKEMLFKNRDFLEKVEKANNWCAAGIALLASQNVEQCSNSPEIAEKYITEIENFKEMIKEFLANGQNDFKDIFQDSIIIIPETKALVLQILQRTDDVKLMCEKRVSSLNKIAIKNKRPVQTVIPRSALPRQPLVGAPQPTKPFTKKSYSIQKMDSALETESNVNANNEQPHISADPEDDLNKIKSRRVLNELLESERIYVNEISAIIKGYKEEAELKINQHLLPVNYKDKFDIIFGNLNELYDFHSEFFLPDLENCISSTELVALCFVQKREQLYKLYSFYCQNLSRSEQLCSKSNDLSGFFMHCQKKLEHILPLAAYLLKPVQRITKYQLLLSQVLKYSEDKPCCKELQQALDCMLIVLKCLNDSMHQIAITGFPGDLLQQGELLLQGSFSVWIENKKDLRIRLKPMRRHLFLYQKAMIFCKPIAKADRNKTPYHFKHYLQMSQIGLTETVKTDVKRFEVWLQGRQEVHIIQAVSLHQKKIWVNEIKKVLYSQLEEIKGEKIKQYAAAMHRPLRQTTSWESTKSLGSTVELHQNRTMSCDEAITINNHHHHHVDENVECSEPNNSSSDGSNSEDEYIQTRGRYTVLADYCAIGNSEVNMKEGDIVELLKVGCAGWWFVKVVVTSLEGWAPAAYLESLSRKAFRSNNRSQDRLNEHQ